MVKKYPTIVFSQASRELNPSEGIVNQILAYSKSVEVSKGTSKKALVHLN